MSVGELLKLQARVYIAQGRDINRWDICIDQSVDFELAKKRLAETTRRWHDPIQTGSDIYVEVGRFFRVPRCYKFSLVSAYTENAVGHITYAAVSGLYGVGGIPEQQEDYQIRNHITRVNFLGEINAAEFKSQRGTEARLARAVKSALDEKLLVVPDEVRVIQ